MLAARKIGRSASEVKAKQGARGYRTRPLEDLELALGGDPKAAQRISAIREGERLESHLVAFSCAGRGFRPLCLGRRMCSTAAKLVDHVLPAEAPVRQWVLTFWAELLNRAFGFDVLTCPCCGGRMKLLAPVTDPRSIARYLRGIVEPTDVQQRTLARGPPYWQSRVLRRGSVEAAE